MQSHRFGRLVFAVAVFSLVALGAARADEPQLLNNLADASTCFALSPSIKLSGEVLQVFEWQYSDVSSEPSYAIVLKMRGKEGEFLSYMGPKQFLDSREYVFRPGDKLDIQGVFASVKGSLMLLGRSYTNGGGRFVLRDSSGSMALNR